MTKAELEKVIDIIKNYCMPVHLDDIKLKIVQAGLITPTCETCIYNDDNFNEWDCKLGIIRCSRCHGCDQHEDKK